VGGESKNLCKNQVPEERTFGTTHGHKDRLLPEKEGKNDRRDNGGGRWQTPVAKQRESSSLTMGGIVGFGES